MKTPRSGPAREIIDGGDGFDMLDYDAGDVVLDDGSLVCGYGQPCA